MNRGPLCYLFRCWQGALLRLRAVAQRETSGNRKTQRTASVLGRGRHLSYRLCSKGSICIVEYSNATHSPLPISCPQVTLVLQYLLAAVAVRPSSSSRHLGRSGLETPSNLSSPRQRMPSYPRSSTLRRAAKVSSWLACRDSLAI